MALEIRDREVEDVVVLDLEGRLIMGAEATALRGAIDSLTGKGKNRVILNLKQVDYIDSTGLGTLAVGHSSLEKAGGAMKLLNLSKRSAELLVLTKLSTIFQMFDDEQAAINSFFTGREVRRFDILEFVRSEANKPQHLGEDGGLGQSGERFDGNGDRGV
ncbi:MAG: STAS domain-containing protein [Acidobacteriaceae bacterium]|nr:STAS domain-containing protein [Acidobacteriaceae bacterium]